MDRKDDAETRRLRPQGVVEREFSNTESGTCWYMVEGNEERSEHETTGSSESLNELSHKGTTKYYSD